MGAQGRRAHQRPFGATLRAAWPVTAQAPCVVRCQRRGAGWPPVAPPVTAEVLPRANFRLAVEAVMFPITSGKLSCAKISDYWSRYMRTAEPPELLALLEQAWWRGEIRGQAASTRLQLLQSMFRALGDRADLGIVFVREGRPPPNGIELPDGIVDVEVTELPDGIVDVSTRYHIPVPSDDVTDWNEQMCEQAFNALAQTSSTNSYPNLTPFFRSIQLSFEEFDKWRKARRYLKPAFWSAPVAKTGLQKPKRGRPPEYKWEQVKARLLEYAKEKGAIQTEKELLQKCGDLAAGLHASGKMPDDKTIRGAIKKYGLGQPPICHSSQ
jgi:hypothetical protein